jgi:hypothetical protein
MKIYKDFKFNFKKKINIIIILNIDMIKITKKI